MSFSGMVKEELSKKINNARHCQIAEMAAFFSALGHIYEDGKVLVIQTENEAVVRKCFTLLRKTFNIEVGITIREGSSSKKGHVYLMEITDPEEIRELLDTMKFSEDECYEGNINVCNSMILQKSCCKRAFIRGAFLSSGSISDPEKGYHFEIVCQNERKALQLQEAIHKFEIDAKIVLRKKAYVVYVKEGAQIVDLLAVMEASIALMDLENIRILKEMRNSVNRRVNCEAANIHKTVNAAVKQMEDIKLVQEKIGFNNINPGLAQIAKLRLQFPDATLKELGLMLSPQVGKSGVNHRLKKLALLAESLRKNKEESYYDQKNGNS